MALNKVLLISVLRVCFLKKMGRRIEGLGLEYGIGIMHG